MKRIKIIQYLRMNQEKVCDFFECIIVIIAGAVSLAFGIAQNKVGFIISIIVLIIVEIFGEEAIKAIINKILEKYEKDID